MLAEIITLPQQHLCAMEFDPRVNTPKGYSHVALDVRVEHAEEVRGVLVRKGFRLIPPRQGLDPGQYACAKLSGLVRFEWLERENPTAASGSENGNAKLNDSDVDNIVKMRESGMLWNSIARQLNVHANTCKRRYYMRLAA